MLAIERRLQLWNTFDWIARNPAVGLVIWDAQLRDSNWRTKEIWQTISRIRQGIDNKITGGSRIY